MLLTLLLVEHGAGQREGNHVGKVGDITRPSARLPKRPASRRPRSTASSRRPKNWATSPTSPALFRPRMERDGYSLGMTKDRAGKIMQYNPADGQRIKNSSIPVDWAHARLKKSGALPESWTVIQCLFGEHLLQQRTKYMSGFPDRRAFMDNHEREMLRAKGKLA